VQVSSEYFLAFNPQLHTGVPLNSHKLQEHLSMKRLVKQVDVTNLAFEALHGNDI